MDPETRQEAIETELISKFISVFDEESLTPEVLETLFLSVQRFSEIDFLKTFILAEGVSHGGGGNARGEVQTIRIWD